MRPATLVALGGTRRPAPRPHAPLPPWDASDAGGIVHTTPPPELVIPPGPDPRFLRADFAGVTLDPARWPPIPVLAGANTTPVSMLMTPMAPLYPRAIQDAILTEHAERGYTHFVVASSGWNFPENGFSWTLGQFVAWCRYVRSWGFYVVYWGPVVLGDPFLRAAVDAAAIDWHIVGEEVDTKVTAEQYTAILDDALAVTANGCPSGAHFTANYPEGFPRDTFLTTWGAYDGRLHLMWQANQDDSAGKQGAMLYYARQRVNLGLVGGTGEPAPNSRVYAFETMATAQLYGTCTEAYGNLRSLELLYTTRRPEDVCVAPVAGFGNGCRLPDGHPV